MGVMRVWIEWNDDGSISIHHPDGWRVADESDEGTLLRPLFAVRADGYCPWCGASFPEPCHTPGGLPRRDHKHRHPYPGDAEVEWRKAKKRIRTAFAPGANPGGATHDHP